MRKIIPSLFFFVVLMTVPALAENKMTIAVLEIKSQGVPAIITKAISDIVLSEFVNIDNFKVTERSQIDKVLNEQALQMTGITDQNSAVKVGKLLSVQKIVIGEVTPFKKGVLVNLRIVDVETGVSEYSERQQAETIDDADSAASQVARKLAQRIVQKYKRYLTAKEPLVYYTKAIVPGWGQIYADHEIKGFSILGLFIATGALSVYTYFNYKDKDKAYHDLGLGTTADDFDSKYREYKNSRDYFVLSLGLMGAVYIANWIDIFIFSKPDFDGTDMKISNYSGGIFMNVNTSYSLCSGNDRVINFGMSMRY